jgi:diguanylate cyclase (GGDEF)-like protein
MNRSSPDEPRKDSDARAGLSQAAIELDILGEKVRLLFSNARAANFTILYGILVIYVVFLLTHPSWSITLWALFMGSVSVVRLWMVKRYQADDAKQPRHVQRYLDHYTLASVLVGLGWGALLVVFFPEVSPGIKTFLLAVAMGVAAGAVTVLASDMRAYMAYTLPIMLSGGYVAFREQTIGYVALIPLMAVFYLMLIRTVRNSIDMINGSLRLRFENEQLTHRAEVASQAKSEFLANISHEIRTPMNGVLGTIQLLRNDTLIPSQQRLLQMASQAAETLMGLIDNVLDFSAIEKGELHIDTVSFDLREVIDEVASVFAPRANEKGLGFSVSIAPDLPGAVAGDASRLKQLLSNLLDNACKFTEQGEVVFTASLLARDSAGYRVELVIRDSGPGIPEVIKTSVFDAFTQGDSSTTRIYGGSGLGLAVTNNIVSLMGGELQLQSGSGRGTRFQILLPFTAVHESALEAVRTAGAGSPAEFPGGPTSGSVPPRISGRVLLVEDDPINRSIGLAMLKKLGLEAQAVVDGRDAVETFAADAFDLILMDCHIPNLDGFQTCERIREIEAGTDGGRRVPIIALTADVQDGVVARCHASGMDGYIPKPLRLAALERNLANWLAVPEPRNGAVPEQLLSGIESGMSSPLIDQAVMDQLQAIGTDVWRESVGGYLNRTPDEILALRNSIELKDPERLWHVAHNLKSASASLGSPRLAKLFSTLEAAGRTQRLDHAESLMPYIESNAVSFLDALASMLDDGVYPDAPPATKARNGLSVLLVDDDPLFRLATGAALRRQGYECAVLDSGRAALQRVGEKIPDLIMLDAVMPELDGFEVCRRMRDMMTLHDVPIMMVTGLDDLESINRAYQAGATTFVIKPLNYTHLDHRIRFLHRVARDAADLRASRARLAAAHRIARIGFWRWNSGTDEFEMSEELLRMCGLEQPVGLHSRRLYAERINGEDRFRFEQSLENAFEQRSESVTDYRLMPGGSAVLHVQQQIDLADSGVSKEIFLGTVQDVTRQKESEHEIIRLAYTDTLTGLGSRAYFQQRLTEALHLAERHSDECALLFLDLDGFKDINDSLGHDSGDELLKTIARRLQASLRNIDSVTRFGGDEFCFLLEELREETDAALTAERLLDAIAEPVVLKGRELTPHASIGVAIYPRDGADASLLLKAADNAMYAAKRDGKHRYAFYRPELTVQAERRLMFEQELRRAIAGDELELHYQPQVRMSNGALFGFEALVRWRHPEKGLIYPDQFITLAEKAGMIIELEKKVMELACRQITEWNRCGLPHFHVAVNISPSHFASAQLLKSVRECLAREELGMNQLELEITESSIQVVDDIMPILNGIGELGIDISIDDFGTGYSSLGSLKNLPVNRLKIDREFIKDIEEDSKSSYFVGSIIGLAHALGLEVIAEGVESMEALRILEGLGCDIVQGYYFSRPIPEADVRKLLHETKGVWPPWMHRD